jgi:16S rRNA processing protein RimM
MAIDKLREIAMEDLQQIGSIFKVHGLQGEVKIAVDDGYLEALFQKGYLIADLKSQKVPYFIESIRGVGQLITKLEGIDTVDDARRIAGAKIYMKSKDLPDLDQEVKEEGPYSGLDGFLMVDEGGKTLARIIRVDSYPMQELALVDYKTSEKLVPLNAATVISIDRKQGRVVVDLPEGLLEL